MSMICMITSLIGHVVYKCIQYRLCWMSGWGDIRGVGSRHFESRARELGEDGGGGGHLNEEKDVEGEGHGKEDVPEQ